MSDGKVIKTADPKDLEENKGITFLSYIGIFFLIPLLAKRESAFAQYHAKQGMVLQVGILVVFIPIFIFGLIPLIGWFILFFGWAFVVIFYITSIILGLINVSKGEMKPVPLVGTIAEQIKI